MSDRRNRYAMIMAGGAGTRLWPMSRRDRPKQLLPFIGGRSLLEIAVSRLDGVVAPERRLVCTAESFRATVRAALPELDEDQILGEPAARNTVNAVGFTAAVLAERDPDAVFAVLTADHVIEPLEGFRRSLDIAFALAESDPSRLVTFGIVPTFPATGYGWVERGDAIDGFDDAYLGRTFDEKPALDVAERYLASGAWYWNSGMFVFHAARFMDALKAFHPGSHAGLREIGAAWETPERQRTLDRVYPELPKKSVDFAIMEPAGRDDRFTICCVPMDVTWMDVGSWPSYGETLPADAGGCRTNARTLHVDSRNVLAVADDPDHLIATVGCADLVIVRTADVTLVCPADRAQEVRALVDRVDESLPLTDADRMRYLAIDLGDKRTGLASGDDRTGIVTPLIVLEIPRGDALLGAVAEQVAAHGPDALVVGLPLNMDGTEGPRAKIARTFGDELSRHCSRPVEYQDERLTSDAANQRMAGSGRTHKQKKAVRDALAAAEILRDFLAGSAGNA